MGSVIGADQPFTDQPAKIETLPVDEFSHNNNSFKVEDTARIESSSVERSDSDLEVNNSNDVENVVLGSPFQSPKLTKEDSQSETPLDRDEISEDTLDGVVRVQTVAVRGQEEQYQTENGVESDANTTKIEDSNHISTDVHVLKEAAMVVKPASTPQDVTISADNSREMDTVPPGAAKDVTNNAAELVRHEVENPTLRAAENANEMTIDEDVATVVNEDSTLEEDMEAAVETPTTAQPTRSVPPHMRPDFQPPRHHTLPEFRMQPTAEGPRFSEARRIPRPPYQMYQPLPHRGDVDREQVARLGAQLMKIQNEFNAERKTNVNLRTTIETEQRQKTEAALSSMMTDLLHKQVDALALAAKSNAKERDLQYREQKIEQLEVYLSEGQKQLSYELEQRDLWSMDEVDRAHITRQVELAVKKDIADIEGKIAAQIERLSLREAAQQMREEQYKALLRGAIESEFREKAVSLEKADEIAEVEHNRGFAAGKEAARRDAEGEARQKGFLEGYGACHRAQTAISNMRAGRIPHDSPALDFLFDASHPHDLYNIGAQLGEMESRMESEGAKGGNVDGKKPVLDGGVAVKKLEEPLLRKAPPSRSTFASELRGMQTMHNGHVVLANGSASPSPAPTRKTNTVNGVNGVQAPALAGSTGESLYTGSRTVRYDSEPGEERVDQDVRKAVWERQKKYHPDCQMRGSEEENLIDLS